ncbi:MAG: TniB family NTP-binding protein, partial [Candidatus Subteraquimicrobiales bacterium]|nr:TniB family NTP-binding protein [Candidatus Subteraquimicrobiales bacterium]
MIATADNCNPMLELFKEEGERRRHWEADLIILKELWQPLIRALLATFNQRDTQRPWSLCVYGGTLSGKTTFFNHAIDVFREYKHLDRYGIIKITCLTNSTLKGIYKDILMGLNWPFNTRDSIQDLEVLVGDAVQKRECKLIIIDEFNQLYNKGDGIRVAEVLKALRNIPNRTLRPLVVVGTMTVQPLLKHDRETNSRFRKIEFPHFESSGVKWDIFREAVYALDQNLKEATGICSNFANRKSVL